MLTKSDLVDLVMKISNLQTEVEALALNNPEFADVHRHRLVWLDDNLRTAGLHVRSMIIEYTWKNELLDIA
jgi:hypothetical protein